MGTIKAYLLMIARGLYRAGLLRDGRHVRLDDELHAELPDPNPGPDVVSGARLDLQTVLESLRTLPESDRAALLMRAQEGMSYDEIAAVPGISVAAAKVKVHRSRIKLNNLPKLERGS